MMFNKANRTVRSAVVLLGVIGLQACNKSFHDIGPPPQLTTIGHEVPIHDVLVQPEPAVVYAPDRVEMTNTSLLVPQNASYFQDTRAYRVGDILTVDISINDSARLSNSSGRGTTVDGTLGTSTDITLPVVGKLPDLNANGSLSAGLNIDREGSVDRNERINLQIAAAVVASAANGNLHIIGSQEVRVNHELRILTVQGIVRAKDILPDNTIPYEKIAEARITYGGHNSRQKPKPKKRWNLFGRPSYLHSYMSE